MNKYLEKIAILDKLLGFHEVYHGTSPEVKDSIHKTGLLTSFGSSGSSSGNPYELANSKGKIHFTKDLKLAGDHATETHYKQLQSKGLSYDEFNPIVMAHKDTPTIIKARLSDKLYNKSKADPSLVTLSDEEYSLYRKTGLPKELMKSKLADPKNKYTAATISHSISPKFIVGSPQDAGIKPFLKPSRLLSYYKTKEGRARAFSAVSDTINLLKTKLRR